MTGDRHECEPSRLDETGRVPVPSWVRSHLDVEAGDELRWKRDEDEIVVEPVSRSAGRGMLVEDDVSEERREEIASELEAAIRAGRRTEWTPD